MFQTWWDLNQQNIRKAIDALAGAAAGYLVSLGEWGALAAPFAVFVVNYAWFWFNNQSKVTIKGLEEANMTGAAIAVEDAIVIRAK